QRAVAGRTEQEKCNEKKAAESTELCFRAFHARASKITPLKTGGIDHRLQKFLQSAVISRFRRSVGADSNKKIASATMLFDSRIHTRTGALIHITIVSTPDVLVQSQIAD